MIIVTGNGGNTLIEAIRSGFQHTTQDLFTFLAVAGGFAAVLVGGYVYQVVSERRKRARIASERLARTAKSARLTLAEYDLLETLSRELRGDGGRRYRIVTDRSLFDKALNRLIEREDVTWRLVASLVRKLGLGRAAQRRSTRLLEAGLEVDLQYGNSCTCAGQVRQLSSQGLIIRLDKECPGSAGGDLVVIRFSTATARCWFATSVAKSRGRTVLVAHQEEILETQERRFFRGDVNAPVLVATPGGSAFRTKMADLSGGGTTILGRGHAEHMHLGSRLKLMVGLSGDERLTLYGRVVRRSEKRSGGEERLHLRFEPMSDRMREKVMRFVLNQGQSPALRKRRSQTTKLAMTG